MYTRSPRSTIFASTTCRHVAQPLVVVVEQVRAGLAASSELSEARATTKGR
jgi:hypothetical protein